ncbi:aminopeptidase [Fulvitalea axinellae]|uniref:Aminopeptidase n=1 Tax=Fulvitalea axinellae TaxID=1182444 RepID=A0AAU9CGB0_9BACT|nr:aminopeptidase [Fulvitalea axinellae]
MEWYLKVLRNYANFNGRARRKEYWMFVLMHMLLTLGVFIMLALVSLAAESETIFFAGYALIIIYSLAILIPSLAVAVRRLHDIGKSGTWFFIYFVPLVGPIWLLVLLASEGDYKDNQYGRNPKSTLFEESLNI